MVKMLVQNFNSTVHLMNAAWLVFHTSWCHLCVSADNYIVGTNLSMGIKPMKYGVKDDFYCKSDLPYITMPNLRKSTYIFPDLNL